MPKSPNAHFAATTWCPKVASITTVANQCAATLLELVSKILKNGRSVRTIFLGLRFIATNDVADEIPLASQFLSKKTG